MEQGFISQRFINQRRTARRIDDDINPAMMTNYKNDTMVRTDLVANKLIDIDDILLIRKKNLLLYLSIVSQIKLDLEEIVEVLRG